MNFHPKLGKHPSTLARLMLTWLFARMAFAELDGLRHNGQLGMPGYNPVLRFPPEVPFRERERI